MTRLLALLLALVASPALAADHYVATTGNDLTGTGAIGAPWATLVKCHDAMAAGDTCWLRGGTYTVPATTSATAEQGYDLGGATLAGYGGGTAGGGTASSLKTFRAYGEEKPVITSTDANAYETMTIRANNDYLSFIGIEFRGRVKLVPGADHVRFEAGRFTCPGEANGEPGQAASIYTASSGGTSFTESLAVVNNYFSMSDSCPVSGLSGSPNFLQLATARDAVIERNDFVDTTSNGTKDCAQAIGLVIGNEANVIRYNYLSGGCDYGIRASGSAAYAQCDCGNEVTQNVIVGMGEAISLWGDAAELYDQFYNNTVVNAGSHCIHLGTGAGPIQQNSIFNNICSAPSGKHVYAQGFGVGEQYPMDFNDYYPEGSNQFVNLTNTFATFAAYQLDVKGQEAGSRAVDPLFVNAGLGNYRLAAASPLRSGGRGTAYPFADIAAYPTVLGAYITGNEQIGCASDPACSAFHSSTTAGVQMRRVDLR